MKSSISLECNTSTRALISFLSLSPLKEGDAVLINSNYAIDAKLNPEKDAIAIEGNDSPYTSTRALISFLSLSPLRTATMFAYGESFPSIAIGLLPQVYNNKEGDAVLINSNYAIDAKLNPEKDAIATSTRALISFLSLSPLRTATMFAYGESFPSIAIAFVPVKE
jgi:hypothetical protein